MPMPSLSGHRCSCYHPTLKLAIERSFCSFRSPVFFPAGWLEIHIHLGLHTLKNLDDFWMYDDILWSVWIVKAQSCQLFSCQKMAQLKSSNVSWNVSGANHLGFRGGTPLSRAEAGGVDSHSLCIFDIDIWSILKMKFVTRYQNYIICLGKIVQEVYRYSTNFYKLYSNDSNDGSFSIGNTLL